MCHVPHEEGGRMSFVILGPNFVCTVVFRDETCGTTVAQQLHKANAEGSD